MEESSASERRASCVYSPHLETLSVYTAHTQTVPSALTLCVTFCLAFKQKIHMFTGAVMQYQQEALLMGVKVKHTRKKLQSLRREEAGVNALDKTKDFHRTLKFESCVISYIFISVSANQAEYHFPQVHTTQHVEKHQTANLTAQ